MPAAMQVQALVSRSGSGRQHCGFEDADPHLRGSWFEERSRRRSSRFNRACDFISFACRLDLLPASLLGFGVDFDRLSGPGRVSARNRSVLGVQLQKPVNSPRARWTAMARRP